MMIKITLHETEAIHAKPAYICRSNTDKIDEWVFKIQWWWKKTYLVVDFFLDAVEHFYEIDCD